MNQQTVNPDQLALDTAAQRRDFRTIANLVEPGSRVLDIGSPSPIRPDRVRRAHR